MTTLNRGIGHMISRLIARLKQAKHATIHDAAKNGDLADVQLHLKKGADINARDNNWEATPLHGATREGHEAVIKALLAAGADVNAKNNQNATPLHVAIQIGHQTVASIFRAAGGMK